MGNIERIQQSAVSITHTTSTSAFTIVEFNPPVPRGVVATIQRSEITLAFKQNVSTTGDSLIIAGLVRMRNSGSVPAGSPAVNTDVARLQMANICTVSQQAEGTPSNATISATPSTNQRNYGRDPHRVAEIRNTGLRSNSRASWAVAVGAYGVANQAFIVANLETKFRYINGHGNKKSKGMRIKIGVNQ